MTCGIRWCKTDGDIMSDLTPDEIYAGLVYSFESDKIIADSKIEMISPTTDSQANRPFVCGKSGRRILLGRNNNTKQDR